MGVPFFAFRPIPKVLDRNVPGWDNRAVQQNVLDRGGEAVVDADIRFAVLASAKRLELDPESETVALAVKTGVVAQEEGLDFDTAFDMARAVLVRVTPSAA